MKQKFLSQEEQNSVVGCFIRSMNKPRWLPIKVILKDHNCNSRTNQRIGFEILRTALIAPNTMDCWSYSKGSNTK
jgi:hypothetical protein